MSMMIMPSRWKLVSTASEPANSAAAEAITCRAASTGVIWLIQRCSEREKVAETRNGAGDGIRTRDINLGKVALYQLSYSRLDETTIFLRAPTTCQTPS